MSAFLEEALADPVAGPDYDSLLNALNAWLDDKPALRALLVGPERHGRSALLSRWVLSASERGRAEVVYLLVRRRFGTALDRDALGFLYARLEPTSHRAQGPAEMRVAIANRLEGGRESDEAPLVLVLDGVENAIGFRFDASLLGEIGPGVRVVVAIDGDRDDWLSRLGWSAQSTAMFSLPPLVEGETGGSFVSGCPIGRPGLDAFTIVMALLSRALGPIGRVDLERLLQICDSPTLQVTPSGPEAQSIDGAMLSQALDVVRDIVLEHERAYVFLDDRVRRQMEAWLPSELLYEADARYVHDGREALSAIRRDEWRPATSLATCWSTTEPICAPGVLSLTTSWRYVPQNGSRPGRHDHMRSGAFSLTSSSSRRGGAACDGRGK